MCISGLLNKVVFMGDIQNLLKTLDDYMYFEGIFQNDYIMNEVREVYIRYPIDSDKDKEPEQYRSEFAKRNAYLSALKKVLMRKAVKAFADELVNHFDIKETTMHFFHNLCKELMGRKVDNKFVIENFSNRIKQGDEFVKLAEKRTASNKIKLEYTYKEMLDLSMYRSALDEYDMENYTVRKCYDFVCSSITNKFELVCREANSNQIPEEVVKAVIAKMEKEKLDKLVNESAKYNPDFHTQKEIKRL